jgi:2-keto-3-deoxy-L-rhamnonate aldolase RhmA
MFLGLKEPAIVEAAGYAGFDYVVIDTEHSLLDSRTLEQMIRAADSADITSIVRIPLEEPSAILRVLDFGANGVMIPHIRSKSDIEKAVEITKYTPVGRRGVDETTRAARYGTIPLREHMKRQNEQVCLIGMIEDVEALENLSEIVSVPGLDMLYIGLADMAVSFGLFEDTRHPSLQQAVEQIVAIAAQANIPVGISAMDKERVKQLLAMGVRFVSTPDVDLIYFTETLGSHLKQVKQHVE